jgi:hypothetical protein
MDCTTTEEDPSLVTSRVIPFEKACRAVTAMASVGMCVAIARLYILVVRFAHVNT